MSIVDFSGFRGVLFQTVLDRLQDDDSWFVVFAGLSHEPRFATVAAAVGLGGDDNPPTDATRELLQALRNGQVHVVALDDRTREVVRAPKGFWWGGWRYCRGEYLQAINVQTRPVGRAYLLPQLGLSQLDKPPQLGEQQPQSIEDPKRLAWRIAERILNNGAGPRGHGRAINLARLVQPELKAAGCDLKAETIADYLREGLRERDKRTVANPD